MPLVSVIIPTYNRKPLVIEAVNSVLSQTQPDLEVIVVDDGSTDDTQAAIKAIKDQRLSYFYKPNGGVSSARNTGLAHAAGKYIAFLDSDDLWPPNFLTVMLDAMKANPEYGIAYCPRRLLYPDGTLTEQCGRKLCSSGNLTKLMFMDIFVQVSSMLFRREVLNEFAFDINLPNAEDIDAWLRLSINIKYLFVPSVEIIYRLNHGVETRKDFSYDNCNNLRVLERFYYRLGGKALIRPMEARRRLSEVAQIAAKFHFKNGHRKASVTLYRRAISYTPWNFYFYRKLMRAFLLSKNHDPCPDWTMPPPLPDIGQAAGINTSTAAIQPVTH